MVRGLPLHQAGPPAVRTSLCGHMRHSPADSTASEQFETRVKTLGIFDKKNEYVQSARPRSIIARMLSFWFLASESLFGWIAYWLIAYIKTRQYSDINRKIFFKKINIFDFWFR